MNLEFVVVGYTDGMQDLEAIGNVKITGAYKDSELDELIAENRPNIAWMSSICPETHSYTLSEILSRGIYPVCFDFGAVAERVRDASFGTVLDARLILDAESLCNKLFDIASDQRDSNTSYVPQSYNSIVNEYYELLD
ncbi:hypothetical protein BR10RB9215_C10244 [Brucella sp. 10RB9215]|nr:hypothetical protein BR10RB9215_C10244 [Brucella sp. 10RB9215]